MDTFVTLSSVLAQFGLVNFNSMYDDFSITFIPLFLLVQILPRVHPIIVTHYYLCDIFSEEKREFKII